MGFKGGVGLTIKINTFGNFDIKLDDESILKKSKRNNKNLELLKYFIAYHNKKLVPEDIIESLWPDGDFIDPKNALRTQIFRLRKGLESVGLINSKEAKRYFDIIFENGFYIFDPGDSCAIDFVQFEERVKEADSLRIDNPEKAKKVYLEVIDIYKGEFLAENPYSEWAFPFRSRYHRIFAQSVLRLFELLRENNEYLHIIDVYERVVNYEPFEESFHVYFLDALIELHEYKNALNHYNYITARLYKEMSVRPTPELKAIYHKITAGSEDDLEKNLTQISYTIINEDIINGALFCEPDYFKSIYNFERRKILRSGDKEFLGLISIIETGSTCSDKDIDIAKNLLHEILTQFLRKGDVFSWWNKSQAVVLLTDISEENLQNIGNRINEEFKKRLFTPQISLEISFQPVGAKESFIQ